MTERERGEQRRRWRWTLAAAFALILAALSWTLVVISWNVEWSLFTATPESKTLKPGRYARYERHFMLGRGAVAVHPMLTYRDVPFATDPSADVASRGLGWAVFDQTHASRWTPSGSANWGGMGPDIAMPTYLLATPVTMIAGLVVWRRVRMHGAGRCQRCGYDRRGLPEDACCPECGPERAV